MTKLHSPLLEIWAQKIVNITRIRYNISWVRPSFSHHLGKKTRIAAPIWVSILYVIVVFSRRHIDAFGVKPALTFITLDGFLIFATPFQAFTTWIHLRARVKIYIPSKKSQNTGWQCDMSQMKSNTSLPICRRSRRATWRYGFYFGTKWLEWFGTKWLE